MKSKFIFTALIALSLISTRMAAQSNSGQSKDSGHTNLYLDVHHLGAGKVTFADVAKAHAKDLATQGKYGVRFLKFWVDESAGTVYCLSSSPNMKSIRNTHKHAHGLLPDQIYLVKSGDEASLNGGNDFYIDVHKLGKPVAAKDVAAAHQKDLAVQQKYGVNLINYWVNEKKGIVVCLSQAPDSNAIISTHKEAHGLLPAFVEKVKQGE